MENAALKTKLKEIRTLKLITNIPFVVFPSSVVILEVLKAFDNEEWFMPFYKFSFFLFFIGFVMLFVQEAIKCPNCHKKFNVKINGVYFVRNLFSSKCMNCGIKANGSNIEEYEK